MRFGQHNKLWNSSLKRLTTKSSSLPKIFPLISSSSYSSSSSSSDRTYQFRSSASLLVCGGLAVFLSYYQAKKSLNENTSSPPPPTTTKTYPIYRQSDVQKHNNEGNRLWVSYKDGIYDVTDFITSHPGGKEKILQAGGKNLSEFWLQSEFRHHLRSPLAHEILSELRIGTLHSNDINYHEINEINSLQSLHSSPSSSSSSSSSQLKYPSNKIYDCIIIGAGISGLNTARNLIDKHAIPSNDILLLDAQDYIGGRVKQITEFIQNTKIDVGAEFLHGDNTELTKFAKETQQPLRKIFCWAHGDGGPLTTPVDKGYGLYFIQNERGIGRLLRFDSNDRDFTHANETLHNLAKLNPNNYKDEDNLEDYLKRQGLNKEMLEMANAGFSNTLCTSSKLLSLKRCIQWENLWHGDAPPSPAGSVVAGSGHKGEEKHGEEEEEEEEHDYTFVHSFSCLVDYLKHDLQIELNSPVCKVDYTLPPSPPPPSGPNNNANPTPSHLPELIKLTTVNGITYYTKSLVITSSPHVLKSNLITFQPPLTNEIKCALETTRMNPIVKVILKFSKHPWPKNLHGMIMANTTPNNNFLLPEMWFRDVDDETIEKREMTHEEAACYVIGFMTTDYAEKMMKLSQNEAIKTILNQMDTVFGYLEPKHMSGEVPNPSSTSSPSSSTLQMELKKLPKPSEVYVGGTFWHWTSQHHPYIGGGYSSPVAGKVSSLCDQLSKPYGEYQNIYFAGEVTSLPGATAHAALESGVRAAEQVATYLKN